MAKAVEYPKPGMKPLCGSEWLREHLRDHTHTEIEALTIELSIDGLGFIPLAPEDFKKIKRIKE